MSKQQQRISVHACTNCLNYSPMLGTVCIENVWCVIRVTYLLGLCCRPSVPVSNNQWCVLHQSGVFILSVVTRSVWAYRCTTPTNSNTAFVFPLVDHLWHASDFLSTSRCCRNWILGSINVRESLPPKVWWLQLRLAQIGPTLVQTPLAHSIIKNYFISLKKKKRQITM